MWELLKGGLRSFGLFVKEEGEEEGQAVPSAYPDMAATRFAVKAEDVKLEEALRQRDKAFAVANIGSLLQDYVDLHKRVKDSVRAFVEADLTGTPDQTALYALSSVAGALSTRFIGCPDRSMPLALSIFNELAEGRPPKPWMHAHAHHLSDVSFAFKRMALPNGQHQREVFPLAGAYRNSFALANEGLRVAFEGWTNVNRQDWEDHRLHLLVVTPVPPELTSPHSPRSLPAHLLQD